MYADDLLLMSASVSGLQRMLDICYRFGVNNSIVFNQRKSICTLVGRNQHKPVERMTLGDMKLEWVNSFKYLGHTFNCGCFLHFDSRCVARKFYGSFNSIFGQCKYTDECIIKLCLVKSFCVPLLTYCIGAIDASDQQVTDLAVCWNDSFWRIFGYKRYELSLIHI